MGRLLLWGLLMECVAKCRSECVECLLLESMAKGRSVCIGDQVLPECDQYAVPGAVLERLHPVLDQVEVLHHRREHVGLLPFHRAKPGGRYLTVILESVRGGGEVTGRQDPSRGQLLTGGGWNRRLGALRGLPRPASQSHPSLRELIP